jgi:hypothetical protein
MKGKNVLALERLCAECHEKRHVCTWKLPVLTCSCALFLQNHYMCDICMYVCKIYIVREVHVSTAMWNWTWKDTADRGLLLWCVSELQFEKPMVHCLKMCHFSWDCTYPLQHESDIIIIIIIVLSPDCNKQSKNQDVLLTGNSAPSSGPATGHRSLKKGTKVNLKHEVLQQWWWSYFDFMVFDCV